MNPWAGPLFKRAMLREEAGIISAAHTHTGTTPPPDRDILVQWRRNRARAEAAAAVAAGTSGTDSRLSCGQIDVDREDDTAVSCSGASSSRGLGSGTGGSEADADTDVESLLGVRLQMWDRVSRSVGNAPNPVQLAQFAAINARDPFENTGGEVCDTAPAVSTPEPTRILKVEGANEEMKVSDTVARVAAEDVTTDVDVTDSQISMRAASAESLAEHAHEHVGSAPHSIGGNAVLKEDRKTIHASSGLSDAAVTSESKCEVNFRPTPEASPVTQTIVSGRRPPVHPILPPELRQELSSGSLTSTGSTLSCGDSVRQTTLSAPPSTTPVPVVAGTPIAQSKVEGYDEDPLLQALVDRATMLTEELARIDAELETRFRSSHHV